MLVLVFDTETTGLPKCKIMNQETLHLWPHIVQFSYIVYDTDLNAIVKTSDNIVKMPDGISIPEEASKIHGITNEMSLSKGISIQHVICEFFIDLMNVNLLVGHNVTFDLNILKIELLRVIYTSDTQNMSKKDLKDFKKYFHFITNFKNIYCTLQESIEFCDIKTLDKYGKSYLKYPKLTELHQKLFSSVPNNLHNSFNDVLVTLRCFMKLKFNTDVDDKCNMFKMIVNNLCVL
jgi:DNA polymerase III epsilon subunit-like protein